MMDPLPNEKNGIAVARDAASLRSAIGAWGMAGETVALIPTMGALHDGHLALVKRGKEICKRTVASIFVNPTQFAANEDLARYPRDEAGDRAKLAAAGCDLVFMPSVAEMYPKGASTRITSGPLGDILEGQFRPGHFAGVATIVVKLLLQAAPDAAIFGEKDYQQLQVIRRVTRDLDIPVRIEGLPTIRDKDGLALSSRNAYLSPEERRLAPMLHKTLVEVARRAQDPASPGRGIEALKALGFGTVDYLEIRDAETLEKAEQGHHARVLVAAWLGKTRLIDNVSVPA